MTDVTLFIFLPFLFDKKREVGTLNPVHRKGTNPPLISEVPTPQGLTGASWTDSQFRFPFQRHLVRKESSQLGKKLKLPCSCSPLNSGPGVRFTFNMLRHQVALFTRGLPCSLAPFTNPPGLHLELSIWTPAPALSLRLPSSTVPGWEAYLAEPLQATDQTGAGAGSKSQHGRGEAPVLRRISQPGFSRSQDDPRPKWSRVEGFPLPAFPLRSGRRAWRAPAEVSFCSQCSWTEEGPRYGNGQPKGTGTSALGGEPGRRPGRAWAPGAAPEQGCSLPPPAPGGSDFRVSEAGRAGAGEGGPEDRFPREPGRERGVRKGHGQPAR